jgi:hypothetical protein
VTRYNQRITFEAEQMDKKLDRRHFLTAGAALAGSLLLPRAFAAGGGEKQRIAMIGTGMRGQVLLKELLRRDDVEVVALCDIDPVMLGRALKQVEKEGKARPATFGEDRDPQAYRRLLEGSGKAGKLDGVIIATPWEWHAEMAIAAMQAKVAVGCEVVAGVTLQDHWDVLNTQLKTGTPYMLLENVCYRRDVMAVLQMVRAGLFGELVHLQGGYQHDLRAVKFNNGDPAKPYGSGLEYGAKGAAPSTRCSATASCIRATASVRARCTPTSTGATASRASTRLPARRAGCTTTSSSSRAARSIQARRQSSSWATS